MTKTKKIAASDKIEIRVLTDFAAMEKSFPLIQQLNPKMTKTRYADLLKDIVKQGNYFQIGCYLDEKLIGLSGIWIGTKIWCGRYLEVDNFIVDEKHRNHGVGRRLIEWAEKKAREERCAMIGLDSYVSAPDAHRFYFAKGFKVEGFHMTKLM